jgi:hypothetical protein
MKKFWDWAIVFTFLGVPLFVVPLLAVLPGAFAGWSPGEITTLVGVLGAAGVGFAAVWAWHRVQLRRAELAALTTDDQAARLLSESLARLGPFLSPALTAEVWETFIALPGESKRALAQGVAGLVADREPAELAGFGQKVAGIARAFHSPDDRPTRAARRGRPADPFTPGPAAQPADAVPAPRP